MVNLLREFKRLPKTKNTLVLMFLIPLYFVAMGYVGILVSNSNIPVGSVKYIVLFSLKILFSLIFGLLVAIWFVVKTSNLPKS